MKERHACVYVCQKINSRRLAAIRGGEEEGLPRRLAIDEGCKVHRCTASMHFSNQSVGFYRSLLSMSVIDRPDRAEADTTIARG